jgi:two-component system, OmpR family, response regulator
VSESSILLFNEDFSFSNEIAEVLRGATYQVTQCYERTEVIQNLYKKDFDLVILDISPAEGEKTNLITLVRHISDTIPILIITANPCYETTLIALRHHAKDYLTKSTRPDDLLERVQSLMEEIRTEDNRKTVINEILTLLDQIRPCLDGTKRQTHFATLPSNHLIQQGPFTVNMTCREIFFEGNQIILSPTEFNYLVVLLRHQPNVVSHKSLVEEAQGFDLSIYEAENLARWHIHVLRKVLQSTIGRDIIHTVRGAGYCIIIP